MTAAPPLPLVIVGGGLAGGLAALAVARARPDVPLLLLERGPSFGGNHTWSFFDSDVPTSARPLVDALRPWRSSGYRVAFPAYSRRLGQGYNSVESARLDALLEERLAPGQWRCNAAVARLQADHVVLTDGETIAARAVIDARGPDAAMVGLELGWQKFVGLEFSAVAPREATIMDATMRQLDGYRFIYTLPLAADRVLVEDTYYSSDPTLDTSAVADRVRAAAAAQGIGGAELRQEQGVLPITIGGRPDRFWPAGDPIPRLGLRGGFWHATTGYSFALALRLALDLAGQDDLSAPALAAWSRRQFITHWRASAYFRLLNRMMFHAALPDERYRIFARFYRLPEPLIARFYRGDLRAGDKLRLLAGRPPVPLLAALRVLARRKGAA